MTSREELAWAAGFFDGEGHVGYREQLGAGQSWAVDIAQTEPNTLDRFHRAVGRGKIYGPYRHKNGRHNPYWRFTANGYERTQAIAGMLWAFLSEVKREQFAEALRNKPRTAFEKTRNRSLAMKRRWANGFVRNGVLYVSEDA